MALEEFIKENTRKPTKPLEKVDPEFVSKEPWASINTVLTIPSIPESLADKLKTRLGKHHGR